MKLNPMRSDEIYPFSLPALPYEPAALEPHITANTFSFHYGKHHQTYVTNLNNIIKDTQFETQTLEDIVVGSNVGNDLMAIFNNAAQVWNHTFFWHCMKPNGGGVPKGELLSMINSAFGSFDAFKVEFKKAALTQFGSGWAWLVLEAGHLQIVKTANADTPMVHGQRPLLTIDVWEHAYYLDFQNRRPDYVDVFLNHLVNWDFVENNLR